jgi:hypothetical protein
VETLTLVYHYFIISSRGANALKGQFTLEYLLLREIMTHSKLKLLIESQNNTLELLLALGFTVLQQGSVLGHSPTQAQKRLWMEKILHGRSG